jgi:hypothetical protein
MKDAAMNDLETELPGLLGGLGRDAPHDPELAERARHGVRRRRVLTVGPIAAVLAVCLVLGGIWITRQGASGTAPVASPPSACRPLETGPLPEWARAGFSQPDGNPFARSHNGSLVAVVFANPLVAPPLPDRGNKILWVPQETPAPTDNLVITGTLEGAATSTTIDLHSAPGPSYVDMPVPGCWHLSLTWGAHTDGIDLRWEPS